MSVSSLASFLGEVARPGLVSMPGLDTVILVLLPPSWAISRSAGGVGLHSLRCLELT